MPAFGAIISRTKNSLKAKKKKKKKNKQPQDKLEESPSHQSNNAQSNFDIEYHHGKTKLGLFLNFIDPIIIMLIAVNAIMMGVGTFDFVDKNPKVNDNFETVDEIFLIIFTVEIILNSIHFLRLDRLVLKDGKPFFPPQDDEEKRERQQSKNWLIFDAMVVIFSWAFASVSIIRAFRILRALRLIAKVKSMRSVILALTRVIPKMLMVGFLLLIIDLVFGIMFTELFHDLYRDGYTEYDYYGRIDLTLLTLFQVMTFDDFGNMARQVFSKYPLAWIPMIIYAILSGFVVVNFIIAIICESLTGMNNAGIDALHGVHDIQDSIHTKRDHLFSGNAIISSSSNRSFITSASEVMDGNMTILNEIVLEILDEQKQMQVTVLQLQNLVSSLRSEIAHMKSKRNEKAEKLGDMNNFQFSLLNPLGNIE